MTGNFSRVLILANGFVGCLGPVSGVARQCTAECDTHSSTAGQRTAIRGRTKQKQKNLNMLKSDLYTFTLQVLEREKLYYAQSAFVVIGGGGGGG